MAVGEDDAGILENLEDTWEIGVLEFFSKDALDCGHKKEVIYPPDKCLRK